MVSVVALKYTIPGFTDEPGAIITYRDPDKVGPGFDGDLNSWPAIPRPVREQVSQYLADTVRVSLCKHLFIRSWRLHDGSIAVRPTLMYLGYLRVVCKSSAASWLATDLPASADVAAVNRSDAVRTGVESK